MTFTNIVTEEIRKSIYEARNDRCLNWCYKDIWHRNKTKVICELKNNHEDDGIDTHFSLEHDLAWEGGMSSHIWFKEKEA